MSVWQYVNGNNDYEKNKLLSFISSKIELGIVRLSMIC